MARRVSGTMVGIATANALALGAVLAATGGTSWAARLIGTAEIKDAAVTTPKLAPSSVTTSRIAAGAVTTSRIGAGAVTGNRIAAGTITSTRLAPGAVTSSIIAKNAVTSVKIVDGAIGARALAKGAVHTEDIANGAVTGTKIRKESVTSFALADKSIGRRHLSKNALSLKWPNADRLDGISAGGFVQLSQHSAVWGERNPDIPVPTTEASIARIDSTALRGDMLIIVRMTLASESTNDDRGTVACRASYGSRASAYSLAGFQRYVAGGGIQIGGNELVITDQHRFTAGPRNTIDVRCKSSTDNVNAKDISIMAIRVSQVTTAIVT